VVLEDLRAGLRAAALRADHVLERDRHAVAVRLLGDREVRVQLRIALVDRRAVGLPELARGDLAPLEQAGRLLGGESERVDRAVRRPRAALRAARAAQGPSSDGP